MQGHRSRGNNLAPFIDNIQQINRHPREDLQPFGESSDEDHSVREFPSHMDDREIDQNMDEAPRERAQQRAHWTLFGDITLLVIRASSSCIQLGDATRDYELKVVHLNQLPSFYGIPNEDPLNFVREFFTVVQNFPRQGLNDEQLRLKCFPFTLKDRAKTLMMNLLPNPITTWEQIYQKFMEKFYSHQKTSDLRRKISNVQQEGEPFHEAWERFQALLIQCPHNNYPDILLYQFFYDVLT